MTISINLASSAPWSLEVGFILVLKIVPTEKLSCKGNAAFGPAYFFEGALLLDWAKFLTQSLFSNLITADISDCKVGKVTVLVFLPHLQLLILCIIAWLKKSSIDGRQYLA